MRELSAQLTEGEIIYSHIDIFTYSVKIIIDIRIANSQYRQIHALQLSCTDFIFFRLLLMIVSASVKLNNQSCLCTIEIRYIVSDGFLPLKTHRIIS